MALHGQRQLGRGNAYAIIAHPHQAKAALFNVDLDPARTGIERIFHQLLDDGSRSLDDLARGDLVNQGGGK